ncbi:MAG: hypothetical protein FD161_418 [Limisphaerales bacterium]|nr:MAG: hypothetical protein FD161_418 [Limisphaerales bacterium]KAG0510323.1 MAG: hypothetical protein E1N63_418 [Limisphaerales bacterium]TXT51510.1 MAG: hypothetical protein FD140_1548 [Limisphaerales bacterium]
MSIGLLVPLSLAILGIAVALMLATRSRVTRLCAALALGGVFLFCIFGFMASFEPAATTRLPWKVGYAALGFGCLTGAVLLLRQPSQSHQDGEEPPSS